VKKDSTYLQNDLVLAQREFVPRYMRWVHSKLPKNDVGYSRSMLLATLHLKGPLTMADLADELKVTRKNITTLVDGLEADGMVKRTNHPTDRRATIIQPSAQGKQLGASMQTDFLPIIGEVYSCLSSTEREQLKEILLKLVAELDKRKV